eukprot:1178535-Pleurochrysis_carterae.AAC.1
MLLSCRSAKDGKNASSRSIDLRQHVAPAAKKMRAPPQTQSSAKRLRRHELRVGVEWGQRTREDVFGKESTRAHLFERLVVRSCARLDVAGVGLVAVNGGRGGRVKRVPCAWNGDF